MFRRLSLFVRVLSGLSCLSPLPSALALERGDSAPAFELPHLLRKTERLSISQYKGQVLLIDFWASWCAPCRESMPYLNALYRRSMGRGFTIIAVNIDDRPEQGQVFLAEFPVDYPVISDASGSLAKSFGVRAMPTAFLLDREGVVHRILEGFKRDELTSLQQAIEQLLDEQP